MVNWLEFLGSGISDILRYYLQTEGEVDPLHPLLQASQVALVVKNPPANAGDIRDAGLILEDPSEGGMATHSSILAGRIPWTEEPGRLLSIGSQRIRHD